MSAVAERPRRKKSQPPPVADPTTAYARDVVEGRIVAGRAVRLACQRHLRDLERQRTEAFAYYFDVTAAQHIIDFFPTFLTLENGDVFILPPWLQFCYGSIFGWKRVSDGLRRFQYGYLETAKGSGKSPSAAGVGLYGMTFDEENYSEIYSAAFDKEQASIIMKDAIRMATNSPELADMLDIGKYNIANLENGSYFRAVSSEHRGKSGPRPHMVLGDEIHEHRDGRVLNRMLAGFKGRKQPLSLLCTNSGSDRASVCWEYHQKSIGVVEGTMVDEQWFAYVCHLDPCDECFEQGYRQPKDGCELCDDWMNPAVWPKVSPAIGIVVQPKYQQDAIDAALSIPSEYNDKRRLNFCIWTETHQIWISSDRWDACKVPEVSTSNEKLVPAVAGLDPSSILDLTSLVVALRHDDPPSDVAPEQVEIDGMDEHGARIKLAFTLNYHVELIPYFWLPEETLMERVRTERIPYDVWQRQGKLFVTPGPAIDHNAVYDFTRDAWKRFRLQKLAMDENAGRHLFMQLRDQGRLGKQIVSVGQGYKLSEAFKCMEMLIAHRRLRHDGHPVLA
jgi:phage terminase large subunit-like protein